MVFSWSVGVNYERKITSWDSTASQPNSKYDNKFSFTFALRGLGTNYSLGTADMLQKGILPYQRAF